MMRKLPIMGEARYLIARALLDICRVTGEHFGDSPDGAPNGPSTHIDRFVLVLAVYVGQYEGRPFTASKLSHYTGMSRATIRRKLEPLITEGMIERKSRGYCLCETWLDSTETVAVTRRVLTIHARLCAKLAKMTNPH